MKPLFGVTENGLPVLEANFSRDDGLVSLAIGSQTARLHADEAVNLARAILQAFAFPAVALNG